MDKKILLLFAIFGVILAASMLNTYAIFAGSHTVYENKTSATEFCNKCHPTKVLSVNAGVHKNAGCSCHGYNPNITDPTRNINVAHNLTKNIYCTNCHSNYNITTGNITIHEDGGNKISGINQSAHYIIPAGNKDPVYERAKQVIS